MRGDILIIDEHHKQAAREAYEIIRHDININKKPLIITVAGESGAGKSEIAASLANCFEDDKIQTFIFQQDDYFFLPPKTNEAKRGKNIDWVGMQEVKLELLDKHLLAARKKQTNLQKPLVHFEEDIIGSEIVDLSSYQVFIAEGTYTTTLKNAHIKIFIDRDINDTRASRKKRAREKQDDFLEKVLTIEHNIISKHKKLADIIITKDYEACKA